MNKKYFKYILLTFITMVGFSTRVNAASTCFYEYSSGTTKLKISYIIDENGNLNQYYTVKDLVNNTSQMSKFGSIMTLTNPANVSIINFKNEAINLIKSDLTTCVNLGSMLDSNGNLQITSTNKTNTEDQTYKLLKPTSDSTSSEDTADPIVDSFQKTVSGLTMTFGKRQSGKYYLKLANSSDSNELTFSGEQTVSLSLRFKGNNLTYMIYLDEVKDMWENGKKSTIRIFNPGYDVRIISLKEDLNGYNISKDGSDNITITVTEKESGNSSGNIEYLSDMCNTQATVVKVARAIGYLLLIVKILVPIGLIVAGIMNFSKAILSGEDALKKNAFTFAKKIVIAIIIFILPTIINFIVGLIDGATDGTEDYENCRICIFDPKNCQIPE